MALSINVNGKLHTVKSTPDTPLLYVLRDELSLHGPKFGCGLSQCGACAVLLNGRQIRACVTPVAGVVGKQITTLEGLHLLSHQSKNGLHPIQQAWIDEQVPQCGYCQSGMMIQAYDLLSRNVHATDLEIRKAMNGHLCRCSTYVAILRAIKAASATMATGV
jgi:aerobic-type carbon monoxide dehydrogenase small subunit (CoxS/CutS family)